MIQTKRRSLLGTLLILANLAFIWGNSMVTGTDSGAMSRGVLQWVCQLLHVTEDGMQLLHLLIRKAAHFSEFALLGLLLTWRVSMTGGRVFCPVLLGGLSTACVDETIQIFVDGRGSSLIDVWIDTCGTAAGMVLLIIGYHLSKKLKLKFWRNKT